MTQWLVQCAPIGDHCIMFVLSQRLSSPRCINGYWSRNRGSCSRGNVNGCAFNSFCFTLVPNALEPTNTPLKGPQSATPIFLFTYKSLAIIFYSEHAEAKKISVKLLKIKGHTFRNTTYSKAIRSTDYFRVNLLFARNFTCILFTYTSKTQRNGCQFFNNCRLLGCQLFTTE